jgi:hypothetical protein
MEFDPFSDLNATFPWDRKKLLRVSLLSIEGFDVVTFYFWPSCCFARTVDLREHNDGAKQAPRRR